MVPLKATPCRSQVLYLFVQRVDFAIEPRPLRFWRIGAAQLIEGLANGEFVYFSHRKTDAAHFCACMSATLVQVRSGLNVDISPAIWPVRLPRSFWNTSPL